MTKASRNKKIIIVLVILLPIVIWLASIAKCEILTLIHGDEFSDKWQENTMLVEPTRLIVLEYSDTYAKIYHKNDYCGNIISFTRDDAQSEWIYSSWDDTVWSSTGSADDFIWPYFR